MNSIPEFSSNHLDSLTETTESLDPIREAHEVALRTLKVTDPAERLKLFEIIQEIARHEVFRRTSDIAQLAVDLYRVRRG